jgi:signal peptidase II
MNEATTTSNSRFYTWTAIAALVVAADQATKWAVVKWVALYEKIPLNSFINLTHHKNPGAAWSFLADAGGWQRWFFIALASIVSVVLVVWLWRIRNERQAVLSAGLALVLGGAIGNLIDRVVSGEVTDFIQVLFGSWAFPSFNVADAGITVGAALLIIESIFFSESGSSSHPEEPTS